MKFFRWRMFYSGFILYRIVMLITSLVSYTQLSCDRFSFVGQVQPLFDQLEIPIDFYLSTPCGISELWLALQVCLIISALVGMCIAIVLNKKSGRVYYDAVAATDAFHARTR